MKGNNKNDLVSAQELAKLSRESYNTIDYWTERKILVCKRVGRRRLYSRAKNLPRIRMTRQRQSRGHSIEGILDEISRQGL
jgi:DNA-binding transcriptional MerR regulator